MSVAAIVIPLVALALCGAAMWLAWRIVKFADAENAGRRGLAVVEPKPEAQPRSAARTVGIVVAALAMVVGLGGIVFVVWRVLSG